MSARRVEAYLINHNPMRCEDLLLYNIFLPREQMAIVKVDPFTQSIKEEEIGDENENDNKAGQPPEEVENLMPGEDY